MSGASYGRAVRRAAVVAGVLGALTTAGANAQSTTIAPVWGSGNNGQVGAYVVDDGSVRTLAGNFAFSPATTGAVTILPLWSVWDQGGVTNDGGMGSLAGRTYNYFANQDMPVTVPDPITGGTRTYNAYSNTNLFVCLYTAPCTFTTNVDTYQSANDANIYNDVRLATVNNGTLNMDISGNFATVGAKNTAYVLATDTGTAIWRHDADFSPMGGMYTTTAPGKILPFDRTIGTSSYRGTFTAFDGSAHTVNSIDDFHAYNTWLISQLQTGALATGAYNTELAKGYVLTDYTITIDPTLGHVIAPDDLLFVPSVKQVMMEANGSSARAEIATGVTITSSRGGAEDGGSIAAVLYATDGGTVVNNGMIGTRGWTTPNGIRVESGGHGINAGVRTQGYLSTFAENASAVGKPVLEGAGVDFVGGAGSTYLNSGIINVAAYNQGIAPVATHGLLVQYGGSAINTGTMNIGVADNVTAGILVGVNISSNGTFTNAADGVIYLGREASADLSVASMMRGGADTSHAAGMRGVYVNNATAIATTNAGRIIIGSKLGNTYAMEAVGGLSTIINAASGVIDVNGALTSAPGQNRAMWVHATAATSENAGTINLSGVNAVAVMVGAAGKVISSGTINITAGSDPSTGLRNYGVWAENAGSTVTLSGVVNMSGDGAIAVHARDRGIVDITGTGVVNFLGGTRQIGYFVHGVGSAINNSGTGAQNVSTEGSTLFRMEDGADFLGGVGAASALTASGKDTIAVLVTGRTGTDVSAFNSGGMTLSLTGDGATGVRVEGGAQGHIASAATISLAGVNAIAGIADGQKYDLAGNPTGAPIPGVLADGTLAAGAAGFGTGTLLVADSALTSSWDGVTGYIARNGAELSNGANLTFTGAHTTGIRVESGSRGRNTGRIEIGAGGTAISAIDSANQVTTVNTSGDIVLNGGSVTDRTIGINASGSQTVVNMTAGNIFMNGNGAIGVQAFDKAVVNLSGTFDADLPATAQDQILFRIVGDGSKINANGSTRLDSSGIRSTLYRLEDGADMVGVVGFDVSGTGARGIYATGAGTTASVNAGSDLGITGQNAIGVYVAGAADVTLQSGATISLVGDGAVAGLVDGNRYALDGTIEATNTGSILTNNANLTSPLNNATGFITQNLGLLVNNGDITFTGVNNTAIKVLNGEFENHGDLTTHGTGVYVEGVDAVVNSQAGLILATGGRAAIELASGASLDLVGSGVGVIEGQGSAHGVLVSAGALGLNVNGAHIIVNAAGATGHGIENAAEISGLRLTDTTIDVADGIGLRTAATINTTNSGTINVAGSGTGIAFQTAAGGQTTNSLDLSGSQGLTINVTGADGTGIFANTTGVVNTAVNVNVQNAAGGSALSLGDGVTTVINGGVLQSISTTDPTVFTNKVTNFTNTATGVITAPNGAGTALAFDAQNTTLTNAGTLGGLVDLGAGNNALMNTGLIDGNLTASGNNTMTVDGGEVTGAITVTADGTNSLLLTNAATINTFAGSGGADTVTVRGNGNTFTTLDGAAGNDTLVFDAASYTLPNVGAITNFEQVNLRNASVFTLPMALSNPGIDIDATSRLAVAPAPAGAFTLANVLTGTGLVTVNTGAGNAFNFDTTTGSAFAGTVAMGPSTFALGGVNTTALTNATLRVDTGSVTTVADGTQEIGGLTFNGGTVIFNAIAPAQKIATSLIQVGALNIGGAGTVQVNVPDPYVVATPTPATEYSLLEQDDIHDGLKLVSATTVTGTGAALTFVDQNGIVVSNARDVNIDQGGNVVAVGTYDYGAGSGTANDGLYVGYRLQQLDLQAGQSLTLTEVPGLSGVDADLSAKLTGTGNLIVAANNTVSLSNGANDFTGTTLVSSGTLQAGANNVIATSSAVTVNTTFDTNGFTQSLNNLSGAATGHVIIGNTTLTLNNTTDTTFAGHMDGAAGQLVKNGAAALDLTGDTELAGLTVNDGTISFAPTTAIDAADVAVTMNGGMARFTGGTITSGGDAFSALAGVSTVELFGTSVTTGGLLLNVASGADHTLIADATTLVGDVLVEGTGLVDLRNASSLTGVATGGNMTIDGTSSWMLTGDSSIVTLTNAGLVDVGGSAGAHRTLTVQNLIGNNGVVRLHTVLGGDNSPSDRIVVDGGTATGSTKLAIVQVGGLGAPTPGNGIQVVEALNGATTGGAFTLAGPVAAGAYEDSLFQGSRDGSVTDSWYLRSEIPQPPVDPTCEETNSCPQPPPRPQPPTDNIRPEVSLYAVANSMPLVYGRTLLDGLHKRVGEEEDLRGRLGQSGGSVVNGAWGRMIGQFGEVDGNGVRGSGPDYDYKLYTMQSGMDVFRHTNDNGHRDHAGFYLAAGRMEADVMADSGRRAGKNAMDAYSLGGYWTHFAPTGWYVDAVLQGTLYNTDITSVRGLGNMQTDGYGLAASLEAGYPINLGGKLVLEPQAQVVWQMTRMDNASDTNTLVDFADGKSLAGRLGARLANSWTLQEGTPTASPLLLTAWVSPNVWHEFAGDTHTTVAAADGSNGVRFNSDLGGTWGEVNVGVNAQINRVTSLIANAGYSFGLGGVDRTAYEGRVGLRVNW